MSGYAPTTSLIKEGYVSCALTAKGEDTRAIWFDRWLADVKAEARKVEREHIVNGLQLVAGYVLKPSDYRNGYTQALSDIESDSLPNAPRFIISGETE